MNTLELGKLYILSGPSGSGKSTFLKNIERTVDIDNMIVSSDKIRIFIQGGPQYQNENFDIHITSNFDNYVWKIVDTYVEAKLSQGLTCFLDATNLTDKIRSKYVKLAEKYNMKSEILIFNKDIEYCKRNNKMRSHKVPENVIDKMFEEFQTDSIFDYRYVSLEEKYRMVQSKSTLIENVDLDIIGDTHGLYEETMNFIESLGYDLKTLEHKDNRKLLFLGDFIDRGPKSIEMLKFIQKALNSGHYALIGNHEQKLIRNYKKYKNNEPISGGFANMKTLSDFLKLKEKEQISLISMLENLNFFYSYKHGQDSYLFVHANILLTDIEKLNKSDCIYGSEYFIKNNLNTDCMFNKMTKDISAYKIIKGHVKNFCENAEEKFINGESNILSLEFNQAFSGYLACYRFGMNKVVKFKSDFNYDLYKRKNKRMLFHNLENLVNKKLAIKNTINGLTIYKYSKKVFFDNLWNEDPTLLKARGIVLGIDGKIVQHPFDKVFNYSENGAGLDIDNNEEVIAVEKLNGFLGNIGLNPYTKKLLISTTGSMNSDYVKYIQDFIDSKLQGKLMKFFSKNKVTLSFEVIHPEDPHIIKYGEKDHGLHLIGVRGLNADDKTYTEKEIDLIAKELELKRSLWFKTSFGELKELVKDSKIEGFMVRKNNKDQDYIVKFKTPYYLSVKFLGRMGDNKIKFMFANKDKFKMSVDEEFYPIVDQLVHNFTLEEFLNMSNEEKILYIQKITTVS